MNSTMYIPEFIKAQSSASLLFAMIDRKPKTGDVNDGEKTVSMPHRVLQEKSCLKSVQTMSILYTQAK